MFNIWGRVSKADVKYDVEISRLMSEISDIKKKYDASPSSSDAIKIGVKLSMITRLAHEYKCFIVQDSAKRAKRTVKTQEKPVIVEATKALKKEKIPVRRPREESFVDDFEILDEVEEVKEVKEIKTPVPTQKRKDNIKAPKRSNKGKRRK